MLNIPPLPNFSSKWDVKVDGFNPELVTIVKYACIWGLSTKKQLRDCELTVDITGVSAKYMLEITDGEPKTYLVDRVWETLDRKSENYLGEILICVKSVYDGKRLSRQEITRELISVVLEASMRLVGVNSLKIKEGIPVPGLAFLNSTLVAQ